MKKIRGRKSRATVPLRLLLLLFILSSFSILPRSALLSTLSFSPRLKKAMSFLSKTILPVLLPKFSFVISLSSFPGFWRNIPVLSSGTRRYVPVLFTKMFGRIFLFSFLRCSEEVECSCSSPQHFRNYIPLLLPKIFNRIFRSFSLRGQWVYQCLFPPDVRRNIPVPPHDMVRTISVLLLNMSVGLVLSTHP